MARASEFKPENPGFDPLAGQVERQFFLEGTGMSTTHPVSVSRERVKYSLYIADLPRSIHVT